jgi:hypothetical protein
MVSVRGFISVVGKILKSVFFGILEEELHLLMKGALIPFKGDHIVRSLFHDLLDNFPLTPQSINGYDTAFEG